MKVKIDKSFEKDTKKVKDKKLLAKVADVIEQVQSSENNRGIKNLKKLKGSHNCYRIRVGEYRIGIIIEGEMVEFIRFLPRKNVYDQFP
ncbi:type II toxin-antitoxin system RelE family toxin [Persicitalea jodogahamensis]|uniref:Plasmid stabilization protein n=1 Tax=Persicitalea jodogahamensis TaxID=402147 RepID=A0A8J3G8D0_9BACT|nr:type II toxin-antitoxin system RelE/ParE family toxin [Persicitalea jodogahamensis]GHB57895.1 hypothetical protein GCM10007390_09170 [Persicitalea jodogahamensis]